MKLRFFSVLISAVLLASSTTIFAGSESESIRDKIAAHESAETVDWSGFYGGLNLGADFAQHDININFTLTSRPDSTAVIGGGQLGINLQWSRFVLGVEGDFQGAADDSIARWVLTGNAPPDPIDRASESFRREISSNWFASSRGRVGFAWNRLLVYATGGAAFADLRLESRNTTTSSTVNSRLTSDGNETQVGWTVGGGVELAMSDHLSVGIEYRHSDFGTESFPNPTVDRFHFSGFTHIDFTADQAVAKINYRFWGFGQH